MNEMVTKLSSLMLLFCLLVSAIPAMAVTTEQEDLTNGGLDSAIEIEHIRSKIQTFKDSEESDSTHLESMDLYKRALAHLIEADKYARKSASYKRVLDSAAGHLQQLQKELAQTNQPNATNAPELLPSASIQELEQRLAKWQAEQFAVETKMTKLDNSIAIEQSRPKNIQFELTELQRELEQLKLSQRTEDSNVVSEAQQIEQQTLRQMLNGHMDMLQQELLSHETRLQLLTAERGLVARRVAISELETRQLQDVVNQHRSELADRLSLELDQAQAEASDKPALIREVTEQNARISDQFSQLTSRIENAVERRDAAASELKQLQQRFRYTRQQLDIAGQTGILGEVLRDERRYLTELGRLQRNTTALQSEIAQAGLSRLRTEKQRDALSNEEQRLKQRLPTADALSQPEREALQTELQQLLQDRGELLQAVVDAENSYLQALHGLDSESKKLTDTVDRFSVLLDKRLLWVSSTSTLSLSWVTDLRRSFSWFFSSSTWTEIADTLRREAGGRLLLSILVLATIAVNFGARRYMSEWLAHTAKHVGNVQRDKISDTFKALGITFLFAAPWPLLMAYSGWLLEQPDASPGALSSAAGHGLLAAGAIMFPLSTYRWLVKTRGVAELHFRWNDQARHVAWSNLRWFLIVVVPLAFIIYMTDAQADELHRAAIGRFAFIGASIALMLFAWRTLRPKRGAITTSTAIESDGWFWNARHILLPLAVGFPIVLIVLAASGYYYTALRLETRLIITLMGIFETYVFYHLLIRWSLIAERRLALVRALAKRSEAQVANLSKPVVEASGDAVPEELDVPEVTLESISEQSRVLIQLVTGLSLLLILWLVWADTLPALSILDDVTLWSHQTTVDGIQQAVPITLKHLALAIVTVLITLVTTRNLPALFELTVLSKLSANPGTRYATIKLSRYVIAFVGTLVALNLVGFQWGQIQWLVAALGIGLGFGLQEIVMNFVSGLIILVEQPIRVGDTVTVGGVSGTVSQIRIRATTIVDWDNKALVVPNKTFITDQLINWTLTGPVTRLVIKVGLAYGSDTELAHRVLMDVARANPLVLEDPAPTVFFLEFGDSALLFELRVFVHDRLQRLPLTDELHMAIDRAFKERGLEIAFPQLDVRMRSTANGTDTQN